MSERCKKCGGAVIEEDLGLFGKKRACAKCSALAPQSAPYVSGSDTSEGAAKSVESTAGSLRAQILELLKERGAMTCDRIEQLMGLRHQTASARVRELVLKHLIYDTGERAPTRSGRPARVYAVRVQGGGGRG